MSFVASFCWQICE